jgi:Pyridoxamine 5'-phosphate oxidase
MISELTDELTGFIETQPMFFVATAAPEGRVNVSPKGMDSLRVLGPNRIVWLNLTGSGNETAAHVAASQRMTLMFMSITATPMIVRVFGSARAIHPRDSAWGELIDLFPTMAGSRQLFDLTIESVRTSCGTGVPVMTVEAVRADQELEPFYAAMTPAQLDDYWARKNTTSIDGYPTHTVTAP